MTADFDRIAESKRVHRLRMAALPIGEKLRMLDALRERELALRGRTDPVLSSPRLVRDPQAPYLAKPE